MKTCMHACMALTTLAAPCTVCSLACRLNLMTVVVRTSSVLLVSCLHTHVSTYSTEREWLLQGVRTQTTCMFGWKYKNRWTVWGQNVCNTLLSPGDQLLFSAFGLPLVMIRAEREREIERERALVVGPASHASASAAGVLCSPHQPEITVVLLFRLDPSEFRTVQKLFDFWHDFVVNAKTSYRSCIHSSFFI